MPWYEWAFSGVGGAGLVALCGLLYRRLARRFYSPASPPVASQGRASAVVSGSPGGAIVVAAAEGSPIAVGSNISQSIVEHHHHHLAEGQTLPLRNSEPTPHQIRSDLGSVLPFDREHASEKYLGIDVLWRVRLEDICKSSFGGWDVFARFDPDHESESKNRLISFSVSSVPGSLRTAPKGTLYWVKGKLRTVGTATVLEDDPLIYEIERPRTMAKPSD